MSVLHVVSVSGGKDSTATLLEEPRTAPLCSHCGFSLPKHGGGLWHYGTHTAHQEYECLRLLHAEIARLRGLVYDEVVRGLTC